MENASDVTRFDRALDMLDLSLGELRSVAQRMMPESLMCYGLVAALKELCRTIPGVDFHYFGKDVRPESKIEILIYRCAYELLSNSVKHGKAKNINIQLVIDDNLISLTVYDNGCGFDPEIIPLEGGLNSIGSQISEYKGKVNIYSTPAVGTEVCIEIELV